MRASCTKNKYLSESSCKLATSEIGSCSSGERHTVAELVQVQILLNVFSKLYSERHETKKEWKGAFMHLIEIIILVNSIEVLKSRKLQATKGIQILSLQCDMIQLTKN